MPRADQLIAVTPDEIRAFMTQHQAKFDAGDAAALAADNLGGGVDTATRSMRVPLGL